MRIRLLAGLPQFFLLLQIAEGGSFDPSNGIKISSCKADILSRRPFVVTRGGADIDFDEEDEDGDGDDEEEEELELDPKLAKAAIQSTAKAQTRKSIATKEAVSSSLKIKKPKRKGSIKKAFTVPYVIRAFMNPFTVFAMTRAYFGSLFNLNFMNEQVRSVCHDVK
jgi:hypothetical protein